MARPVVVTLQCNPNIYIFGESAYMLEAILVISREVGYLKYLDPSETFSILEIMEGKNIYL